jgi:hypothetical protein
MNYKIEKEQKQQQQQQQQQQKKKKDHLAKIISPNLYKIADFVDRYM